MEKERIEELKHHEELLFNCIDYLIELWSINDKENVINNLKNLNFTKEDIKLILDIYGINF